MKLSNDIYLRSAFRELDAFSIPGLGTFTKVYHAAHEKENEGALFPPSINIEFSHKVHEDLLLQKHLVQNNFLEKKEAEDIVKNLSKAINFAIQHSGNFELTGIGKLSKDKLGNLDFYPAYGEENVFSQDFFGLQPVEYEHPKRQESKSQASPPPKTTTAHMYASSSKKNKQKSLMGWKGGVILSSIVLLGLIAYLNGPVTVNLKRASLVEGTQDLNLDRTIAQNNVLAEEENKAAKENTVGEEIAPNKVADKNAQNSDSRSIPSESKESSPKIESTPRNISVPKDTESTPKSIAERPSSSSARKANSSTRMVTRGESEPTEVVGDLSSLGKTRGESTKVYYYIISGSYSSQETASAKVAEMRRKGIKEAVILYPPLGSSLNYRVSLYKSSNKSLVDDYVNVLLTKGLKKKDFWILKEDN